MANAENKTYRVDKDGFFGELFQPETDKYPGKALICFSGSDGGIELARTLAGVFQARGADHTGSGLCAGRRIAKTIFCSSH